MKLFYSLYISFLNIAITIAAPFNLKAKKWKQGRSKWEENLKRQIQKTSYHKMAWFHVSSLGEYEQAIPLIKKVKTHNYTIAVSFFSSSGFENVNDELLDVKFYLPLDKKSNAKKLLSILKPSVVFWIKNDFWINTLEEINKEQIPLLFVSFIFTKDSFFLNKGFPLVKNSLAQANHIFVQNEESHKLLIQNDINNVKTVGDTRISRVRNRLNITKQNPCLETFRKEKKLIFYASVHPEDLKIITDSIAAFPDYKHVIIPHEIDTRSVNALVKNITQDYIYYDQCTDANNEDILIVNKIGLLFDLYQYADIVYIGGGFGKGIHNILEPTVFRHPVLFGPKYNKFEEALKFINLNLCFSVNDSKMFENIVQKMTQAKKEKIRLELDNFYLNYPDPAESIMEYCKQKNILN